MTGAQGPMASTLSTTLWSVACGLDSKFWTMAAASHGNEEEDAGKCVIATPTAPSKRAAAATGRTSCCGLRSCFFSLFPITGVDDDSSWSGGGGGEKKLAKSWFVLLCGLVVTFLLSCRFQKGMLRKD